MIDCYTTYKLLFYGLDSLWEENNNSDLGQFLSEMNPLLFEEEGSADPAIYNSFKEKFNVTFPLKTCEIEQGYYFSIEFLKVNSNMYAKIAATYFSSISLEDWNNAASNLLNS